MRLNNPVGTIVKFLRLVISRYVGINLMGEQIENIFNYLKIDDHLATGGQPTEQQLFLIKAHGYQLVINLALPTSENALPNECQSVESLAMEYVTIPIDFNHPTKQEFAAFCQVMTENQDKQIFIHCAANLRVSAFVYLYRRIILDVSKQEAQQDLEKLWTPNQTWQKLIDEILADQQTFKT